MNRRAFLLVLVGLVQTWVAAFVTEKHDNWVGIITKAVGVSVGVNVLASILEYFLAMGVVIQQISHCVVSLVVMMIGSATCGIFYLSIAGQQVEAWMLLVVVTLGFDLAITQNVIASVKASILTL